MPLRLMPEGVVEPSTIAAGFAADPLGRTFRSLALARCLGVIARLGLFAELAGAPRGIDHLSDRFALRPQPLRLMLDVLVAEHYLDCRGDEYALADGARQWLDPESPSSVTTALSYTLDYWGWWSELDQVAAGGAVAATKPDSDDEVGWARRVRGQAEFARSIGEDLADAVDLPRYAQSIIDLGSAHGAYSTVLCRRNPMLRSVVIDEPAANSIGRELAWEASMDRAVTHRDGDLFTADLGGPHDAVVCAPFVNGLNHDQTMTLLRRVRGALQPGGILITLRPTSDRVERTDQAWHRLFLQLASRVDPSSAEQFRNQLSDSGFGVPRVHELAAAPQLSVYVARAL